MLEPIIKRLLNAKQYFYNISKLNRNYLLIKWKRKTLSKETIVSETEIKWLINQSKKIFTSQSVYLELISPIYVAGILLNELKYSSIDTLLFIYCKN